ncbi:MAG: hypothetical protein QM769_01330 [Pseudoxanthomonas sp.]
MHVRFIGSRFSGIPAILGPGRLRQSLLAVAGIGLLFIGQAAAQQAPEPASAQAAAPATTEPGTQAAKLDKNGKVCKYEEVTGSRFKKRVCFTPEQWEAREATAKQFMRELDGKPVGLKAERGD